MNQTITIFGDIGGNVTAEAVNAQLAALDPTTALTVEINSEGGSVSEAVAIYNVLRAWRGPVDVTIVGWALSAATVVAMAGKVVRMNRTSLMMVHAPWMQSASGNAAALRQRADALDSVAAAMREAYRRTKQPESVIDGWLGGEDHWFTSDQALDAGLVDEIIDETAHAVAPPVLAACRFPVPLAISERILKMTTTEEQIRAQVLAKDLERRREIRMQFQFVAKRSPEMAELVRQCEDDPSVTLEAASTKVLALMGKDVTPCNPAGWGPRMPAIGGVDTSRASELRAAAVDVLLQRAGIKVVDPHPAARDIQRLNIVGLAERMVSMSGGSCAGMSKGEVIQAAMSTSDFPALLSNLTGRSLRAGYQSAAATHAVWTAEREVADFRPQTLAMLSEAPSLTQVEEGAEYTYGSFRESAESFTIKTYGKIVRFTRQALINDDLSALTNVPNAQGAAARRLEADLVYAKLTANAAMSDGVPLFHADHGNLVNGAALSVDSLGAARAAMRSQRGIDGAEFLDPQPRFLIVPVALETKAEALLNSTVDPARSNDSENPAWIRGLQLVADPRLDADSTVAWYLAADPSQIEGIVRAYLVGEPHPYLENKEGWDVDSVDYKVRMDFGVGVIDYRGLLKNPGA